MPPKYNGKASYEENFWSHVDIQGPDDCWEWQLSRDKRGYGQAAKPEYTGEGAAMVFAHRMAWQLTNGPIPDGMNILHQCDNPPCCNPAHLFPGTTQDNIQDKLQKGRAGGNHYRDQEHGSKVTWEMVREMRRLHREHGLGPERLARLFPLKKSQIGNIIYNKAWIE